MRAAEDATRTTNYSELSSCMTYYFVSKARRRVGVTADTAPPPNMYPRTHYVWWGGGDIIRENVINGDAIAQQK